MVHTKQDIEIMLPLTSAQIRILLILADGERHGYSILREIERVQPQVRIGPATLYRAIKQLLERGWIVEIEERPDPALDDERRHYYRLSDLGRRVAQAEAQRLAALVGEAQRLRLLPDPVEHEQPNPPWLERLVRRGWMQSLLLMRLRNHEASPAHDEKSHEEISASSDSPRTRRE